MYPQLNLYFFHTSAYSFFIFLALIVVVLGSHFFALKRGFFIIDSLWMLLGMSFAVFIGARLLNLLVNFDWYIDDLSRIYSLNTKGFSLYGGIVFAMLTGFLISKVRKIELLKFADTVIPFVGIGIVLMRIGCFLNGCCFGKTTNVPWAVQFPQLSPAHKHQIIHDIINSMSVDYVHPTQLYELIGALLISLLAFIIINNKYPVGTATLVSAICFSLIRWVNIYFRVLPYEEMMIYVFYPIFYLLIITGCVYWLFRIGKKYNN